MSFPSEPSPSAFWCPLGIDTLIRRTLRDTWHLSLRTLMTRTVYYLSDPLKSLMRLSNSAFTPYLLAFALS